MRVNIVIKTLIFTVISMFMLKYNSINVKADEPEILTVSVREHEGREIISRQESPIYSAEPLDFEIAQRGEEDMYYSLSVDGGNSFGRYIKMDSPQVTLYPDKSISPTGEFAIRFFAKVDDKTSEDDESSAGIESEVFRVIFDNSPAKIELSNDEIFKKGTESMGELKLHAGKDIGYISRILARCGENVLFEKRFNSSDAVKDYDFAIPVISQYLLCAGGKVIVSVEDEAGNYSETSYSMNPRPDEKSYGGTDNNSENKDENNDEKVSQNDYEPPKLSVTGIEENKAMTGECDIMIEALEENYEGGKVTVNLVRTALGQSINVPVENYNLQAVCDRRNISLKRDGEYSLNIKAEDAFGNTSSVSKCFTIDNTAPDIKIMGIEGNNVAASPEQIDVCVREMFFENAPVNIMLEKKDLKGNQVKISSRDYKMKEASDCFSITGLSDGEYKMTVTASDFGGNAVRKEQEFKVDMTPPVIADLSEFDGKYVDSFSLRGKLDKLAKDMTKVRVSATLNDADITENDVIIGEGKYKLRITACDEAGNTSHKDATFIIDHTPPQIVIEGADAKGNVKPGGMVKVSLFDNEDTLESVSYNGRNVAIKENTAFVKIDTFGDNMLSVKARDSAGNILNRVI